MESKQPSDNLKLWNRVCETDPKHTKKVTQRGGYTAVDPQHQLQVATELWGPYGSSWGLGDMEWSMIDIGDKPSMVLDCLFEYPSGRFQVSADMPYRANDDCRKKLITACRSKALSTLGFNADIFLGKYDDDRYVSDMTTKHSDHDALRETVLGKIRTAQSADTLTACRDRLDELRESGAINQSLYGEGLQAVERQERELSNGSV